MICLLTLVLQWKQIKIQHLSIRYPNTKIKNKTKLLVYFVSIVYFNDSCQSNDHYKIWQKLRIK